MSILWEEDLYENVVVCATVDDFGHFVLDLVIDPIGGILGFELHDFDGSVSCVSKETLNLHSE